MIESRSPIPDTLVEEAAKTIAGVTVWDLGDDAWRTAFRNIARRVVEKAWVAGMDHAKQIAAGCAFVQDVPMAIRHEIERVVR